ncbi:conserved exported hypothetical protein [Paraburkholderia ribeironis]|uniref:Uncharacterized protein n=1 Tax=Paraburkholderia ribeironis TaxID=1247936 RepID=A0A1N7SBA4_9BURK|nr:hypothetical protein [Paraburkholderia ribeironis]SIT44611.1 conserved exported hypothetical protein [Paraburkholderia ribeironis]
MTCLKERIVGAIFFMLSGFAFAGGLDNDLPEAMTVANVAPPPMVVAAPIPEPKRYVYRYAMEYQSNQGGQSHTQIENIYSAQVTHEFLGGTGKATPPPAAAPQPASHSLHLGPSTAPQLALIDVANTTLTLGAQPQRRLSLTVDNWVFSATARIAILHSHSTGATLNVRHRF